MLTLVDQILESHRRWVLTLCVVLVALTHACDLYHLAGYDTDEVVYIALARSLLAGRGYTLVEAHGVPAQAVLVPAFGRPPGYASVVAAVLGVTHEIWWSTYAIDLLFAVVFLLAMVSLVRRTFGDGAAILTGATWAVLYSPVSHLASSDLAALALFVAGLLLGSRDVSRASPQQDRAGLFSGLLAGAACAVRYAYWPLIVVVPVATLVARRDRWAVRCAGRHLTVAVLSVCSTAVFMRWVTSEVEYVTRWYPTRQYAWYWDHFLAFFPFPAQVLRLELLQARLVATVPTLMFPSRLALWGVSAGLVLVLYRSLRPKAIATWHGTLPASEMFFHAAAAVTVVTTLGMLIVLTGMLPIVSGFIVGSESRYFAPIAAMTSVWFVLAAVRSYGSHPWVRRAVVAILIGTAAITVPYRLGRIERYWVKNYRTAWLSSLRRADASAYETAVANEGVGAVRPLLVDADPIWGFGVGLISGGASVRAEDLPACGPPARVVVAVPHATDATGTDTAGAVILATHARPVATLSDRTLYAGSIRPCGAP